MEELLLKKKWRNVQKDPLKAINDQHLDTSSYWQQLNQLPPNAIEKIVNSRILDYDKSGCDTILKKILDQKQIEDSKRNLQAEERERLRNKLRARHNAVMELEHHCGVRLGMPSSTPKAQQQEPAVSGIKQEEFSVDQIKTSEDDLARVQFTNEISNIEAIKGRHCTEGDTTLNSIMRETQQNA